MQQLYGDDLLVVSGYRHGTLRHTLNRMKECELALPIADTPFARQTCRLANNCFMRRVAAPSDSVHKDLVNMADRIVEELPRLCLGCTLDGKVWKEDACKHDEAA